MKKIISFLMVCAMLFAMCIFPSSAAGNATVSAPKFSAVPNFDGAVTAEEWGEPTAYVKADEASTKDSAAVNALNTFVSDTELLKDHNFKLWLRWDDNNFYIAAQVEDPDGYQLKAGNASIWDGDCFQFRIDPKGPAAEWSDKAAIMNTGCGLPNGSSLDKAQVYDMDGGRGLMNSASRYPDGKDAKFGFQKASADNGMVDTYEIAIPWHFIGDNLNKAGTTLGMSAVSLNASAESDKNGFNAYLTWGSGVCGGQLTDAPQTAGGSNAVTLSSDAQSCTPSDYTPVEDNPPVEVDEEDAVITSPNQIPGKANPSGGVMWFNDLNPDGTTHSKSGWSGYSCNVKEYTTEYDGVTVLFDVMFTASKFGANGEMAQIPMICDYAHTWTYSFAKKHKGFEISYAGWPGTAPSKIPDYTVYQNYPIDLDKTNKTWYRIAYKVQGETFSIWLDGVKIAEHEFLDMDGGQQPLEHLFLIFYPTYVSAYFDNWVTAAGDFDVATETGTIYDIITFDNDAKAGCDASEVEDKDGDGNVIGTHTEYNSYVKTTGHWGFGGQCKEDTWGLCFADDLTAQFDSTKDTVKAFNYWKDSLKVVDGTPHAVANAGLVEYVYSATADGKYGPKPTEAGTYFVKAIVNEDVDCFALESEPVEIEIAGSSIGGDGPVVTVNLGDVNGDAGINTTDVVLTLRYLAGWELSSFDEKAADVNGDGNVNTSDAVVLLRYLAGWELSYDIGIK